MRIDTGQLQFLNTELRSLVGWLENETGLEFTITSLYRMNDNGVHGVLPVRGCDLRIRNLRIGKEIENFINHHWIYDPERPDKKCAVLHGDGANLHIHLQVHPNTESVF